MIPMMRINQQRNKRSPLLFSGLSRKKLISDDKLVEGLNLSSENLPAITTRKPRELIRTVEGSTWMTISTEGKEAQIVGTNFQYDGVTKFTVSAGEKSLVDFNGFIVVFPDKKYYCYDALNPSYGTNGTFTAPAIDYAVEFGNRIWAVEGNNIYASKLGDFKLWSTFDGFETDSWATDIAGAGRFSDIIKYQNHIVLYKQNQIFEMYGYRPSQFQVQEVSANGSVNYGASAEGNSLLLFVGQKNIYVYSGGMPKAIADDLDLDVTKARVGTDGELFYIYMINHGVKELLVYDPTKGAFMPEDSLEVINFIRHQNAVYSLDATGKVTKHGSGTEDIDFSFTTKEFDNGISNKQIAKYISLKVDMEHGSEITVQSRINGGAYVDQIHIIALKVGKQYHKIPVYVQRCETYQIRILGKGNVVIYGEREFMIGSDFNV